MTYYKVIIWCETMTEDDEGNIDFSGNIWEETPSTRFHTLEEAEDWIIRTFDLKKFELYEDNNELLTSYNETEDGKEYIIEQRISINKYEIENMPFKKLIKEMGDIK